MAVLQTAPTSPNNSASVVVTGNLSIYSQVFDGATITDTSKQSLTFFVVVNIQTAYSMFSAVKDAFEWVALIPYRRPRVIRAAQVDVLRKLECLPRAAVGALIYVVPEY